MEEKETEEETSTDGPQGFDYKALAKELAPLLKESNVDESEESASAGKPAGNVKGPLTIDAIRNMTEDQINENWDEVKTVLESTNGSD